MHVIEQLVALLRADTDVTNLVGTRIFSDVPPQDTIKPSIEIYNVSDDTEGCVDLCTVTMGVMMVQFNSLGRTRSEAWNISTAIRRAIIHHTSSDSEQAIQDVNISSGSRWEVIRPQDGSDSYTYECQNDYNIPYRFSI